MGAAIIILLAAALFVAGVHKMSAALDRLTASIAAETTVEASILSLLSGLAQQIRDNVDDSAALNALADQVDADTAKMTEAVTANTPAAPAGQPQPDPGA